MSKRAEIRFNNDKKYTDWSFDKPYNPQLKQRLKFVLNLSNLRQNIFSVVHKKWFDFISIKMTLNVLVVQI